VEASFRRHFQQDSWKLEAGVREKTPKFFLMLRSTRKLEKDNFENGEISPEF
jgi:hypothetical protein